MTENGTKCALTDHPYRHNTYIERDKCCDRGALLSTGLSSISKGQSLWLQQSQELGHQEHP